MKCSSCGTELTFREGLKQPTPFRWRCSRCKALYRIETPWMKPMAVGVFALFALLAWGLASGTEKFGLAFLFPYVFFCLGVLLSLEILMFRYIIKNGTFTAKGDINAPKTRSHSILGIASLIISIGAGALGFLTFIIIAGGLFVAGPDILDGQENVPAMFLLGLMIYGILFFALVAFGIGISSLITREENKIFAILGVVFSSALALVVILMMLLGEPA